MLFWFDMYWAIRLLFLAWLAVLVVFYRMERSRRDYWSKKLADSILVFDKPRLILVLALLFVSLFTGMFWLLFAVWLTTLVILTLYLVNVWVQATETAG